MPSRTPTKRGNSRVWLFENGTGPNTPAIYVSDMIAQAPAENFGAFTRIESPDPNAYDKFVTVGQVRGARERPTMPVMGRYSLNTLSDLKRIGESGCRLDVQIHLGDCQNPADFNSGWSKILAMQNAFIETWGLDGDLGALDSGNNAAVNEVSTITADAMGEIVRMKYARIAAAELLIAGEINAITVCQPNVCTDCQGCQDIFAASSGSVSSPTGTNDIVYSTDGGMTWDSRAIHIWGASSEITSIACAGEYLLIFSLYTSQVAYMRRSEFLDGTGSWTVQTMAQAPEWVFVSSPSQIWIAADNGYVYIMRTPTGEPEAVLAGSLTTETLRHIHAYDEGNVVAVGDNNAVVYSNDGGETWVNRTGPAGGVNLTKVQMRSATEWHIGTEAGFIHYTMDAGLTWSRRAVPFEGSGAIIKGLAFAPMLNMVGWADVQDASNVGHLLRTIDGGRSWYVTPETGSTPAHRRINDFAVCGPNKFFAGGLWSNGTDSLVLAGTAG